MNLGIITAITYGILTVVGGIMGYVKAKSKISLIAGVACGLLLILGGTLELMGINGGLLLAAVIAAVLVVAFTMRLVKTRKFMPSGVLLLAALVSVGLMLYQLSAMLAVTG